MKKYLLLIVAVVAVFASCKKVDPIPEGITLKTDTVVDLKDSNFATIEFTASQAWAAQIIYATDEVTPFAKADVLSGEAGDGKIKLTVESLPDGTTGRFFGVVIGCDSLSMTAVTVLQGKVFEVGLKDDSNIPVAGGTKEFVILTNCTGATFTPASDDWISSVVYDKLTATVTMTAKANTGYDPRSASCIFRVPEIPVDSTSVETWEPTGIMVPATYYVTLNQDGNIQEAWCTNFDTSISLSSAHSIAKFGDEVYVANAYSPQALFVFDAATGANEGTLDISGINSQAINSITLDDEGNLVMAFGGAYAEGTIDIYRVKAGKAISVANAEKLISCVNSIYGYGLAHIKAAGSVYGKAAISAVCATPTGDDANPGTGYIASWQINGGVATSQDYVCNDLQIGCDIWYSGDLIALHTDNDINGGMLYMGYDNCYDLKYKDTPAGEWKTIYNPAVTWWGENLSALDVVEWNSQRYILYDANAFFPEWGMASYIGLLEAGSITSPTVKSVTEHYTNGGVLLTETNEKTADVCGVVENGALAAYVVDGGNAFIKKIVYPVL